MGLDARKWRFRNLQSLQYVAVSSMNPAGWNGDNLTREGLNDFPTKPANLAGKNRNEQCLGLESYIKIP